MSKGKILVVEDENIVAMDLKRRLTKLGYQVVGTASNAVGALSLVVDKSPDLVLMDIRIQGHTDGIETAKVINENHKIPVIFLTAHSEEPTLNRALASMPYGYLLKPCSEKELHANIQVAMEKSHADRKMRESREQLRMAINAGNMVAMQITPQSPSLMLSYTQYGRLSAITDWESLQAAIFEEDRALIGENIEYLQNNVNHHTEMHFRAHDEDSGEQHLALFAQSYADNDGTHIVGVLQDVTERRIIERNLRQISLAFNASSDGIALLDENYKVINASSTFFKTTGSSVESVIGNEMQLINPLVIGTEKVAEIEQALREKQYWSGDINAYRENREPLFAWVNIKELPAENGLSVRFIASVADISEVLQIREKLSQVSLYDPVTQLPKLSLFLDRLAVSLTRAARENKQLAVLYLDLDHFNRVNDSLGYQVGDSMLKLVASRLRAHLRTGDSLCRSSADEFILLIENYPSEQVLTLWAESLLRTLDNPLQLLNTEVIPRASIGISLYPHNARHRDDLINMANTAMYSAKSLGRHRIEFYKPEMTRATRHYLKREMELLAALRNGELRVFYQPQYDVKTMVISGVEALIRWQHPEKGILAANEIIPVAEMSDLIVTIGDWVIDEVCRQFRVWEDAGYPPQRVAFNVSPRQLLDDQFIATLAGAIHRHRISPGCLELEITESCLQDSESAVNALRAAEDLGLTISIDDFGTGFSCLSSLKTLPIHRLKIDRSFIRDIPHDESGCAIAKAILALSQQLNLRVTAEGIETAEQAAFIGANNCHDMQGFLFSKPLDADKIGALLAAEK